MTCEPFQLENGATGIVCGRLERERCACGRRATLLCDWKVETVRKTETCDRPICSSCTTSPARDKDLCPEHARAFEAWKANRVPTQ